MRITDFPRNGKFRQINHATFVNIVQLETDESMTNRGTLRSQWAQLFAMLMGK